MFYYYNKNRTGKENDKNHIALKTNRLFLHSDSKN